MYFAWDIRKSDANLAERGFDFAFATLIFSSPTLERADIREDYGEQRILAIGVADNVPLTVVYTDRMEYDGELIRRIISARVSNQRERKAYTEAHPSRS